MAVERTVSPYRTQGPNDGSGRSWEDYFRTRRSDQSGDTEGPDRSVTVQRRGGAELPDGFVGRSFSGYRKALEAKGFTIGVWWWTTFATGGVFGPDAEKAGQEIPDRTVDTILMDAYLKPYGYCRIVWERANNKNWVCSYRWINHWGNLTSDTDMKEWIKNAGN